MTHESLQSAMNSDFAAVAATINSYNGNPIVVSVQYDNQASVTPNKIPWVRFMVKLATANQKSIGSVASRRFRKTGICMIQIFVPLGEGSGLADYIAGKIENAYTGVTKSGGIVFQTPLIYEGKRSDGWWQVNVNLPFYSDRLA